MRMIRSLLGEVDAGGPSNINCLIAVVENSIGTIDVLHYNAGLVRESTLAVQPLDTLNSDFAINIGGVLAAIKSVENSIVGRGTGTILRTSAGLALAPPTTFFKHWQSRRSHLGAGSVRVIPVKEYTSGNGHGKTSILPKSLEATVVGEQF